MWSFADVPDQSGRTVVVTGGNSGLGLAAAEMFVRRGAAVVIACRNPEKARVAADRIGATPMHLDLADLESVTAFAEEFARGHDRLDVLVNNAGVMWAPFARTAQGFEMQLGTNHLGHFALTGRLLPLLLATPGARVTTLSSMLQATGRIDLDDLNWERRRFETHAAYAQSKLANLIFALELQRRAAGALTSTAAHPGWSDSNLTRHANPLYRALTPILGMPARQGALPTMRAATAAEAKGGSYWAPRFVSFGFPAPARIPRHARNREPNAKLWDASARMTGVSYFEGV